MIALKVVLSTMSTESFQGHDTARTCADAQHRDLFCLNFVERSGEDLLVAKAPQTKALELAMERETANKSSFCTTILNLPGLAGCSQMLSRSQEKTAYFDSLLLAA